MSSTENQDPDLQNETEDPQTINMMKICMEKMGKLPRSWQVAAYKLIRGQKKDVVVIAGTGAGKTLAFMLLMLELEARNEPGVLIIISPLTELQNEQVSQSLVECQTS